MIRLILTIFLFSCQAAFGLTFAWISDTHIEVGRKGLADTERRLSLSSDLLTQAIKKINMDDEIEFVIVTGDLINDGRSYNLDSAVLLLENLKKPCFITLGNNDLALPSTGFGISKQTFFSAFPETFTTKGKGYWSKVWKDYLLIGIDAYHPGTGENLYTYQFIAWFKKEIEKYSGKKIMVFSHFPPISFTHLFADQSGYAEISDPILEYLKTKPNFIGYFAGHLHLPFMEKVGGMNILVANALVQYPHVYYKVNVNSRSIDVISKGVATPLMMTQSKTLFKKYIARKPILKAYFNETRISQLEVKKYYKLSLNP